MIQIREYLTTKIIKPSIIKATDDTIKQIIKEEMDKYGHDCDLNHVDVSEVTDMDSLFSCDYLFFGKEYLDSNPDISEWNVSNVTYMGYMFYECENFNCNISKWDVSNVKSTMNMFLGCENFNQDLRNWNVENVENMWRMFKYCKKFNSNICDWNVHKVEDMSDMFYDCYSFNQDLSKWDVSNVLDYSEMFWGCPIEEKHKPHFKS